MRKIIIGLVSVALLVNIIFWGFSTFIYLQLSGVTPHCEERGEEADFTPENFAREGEDLTPYLMDEFEDVRVPGRDEGIELAAWFIPPQNGEDVAEAPAVIIVHGINDCRNRPQSLTPAGMLTHSGFSALVIDQRDHGESTIEDGRTAIGTEEYRDVLGAWDWLQEEKDIPTDRIGLFGYSLGAGTVMIAAGEEPGVAAVWEDSGWGSTSEIIEDELSRSSLPGFLGVGAPVVGQVVSGDNITSLSPIDAMSQLDGRPIYIVHGDADERIDVRYAFDLADAASATGSPVETWIVPGTDHVEAMFDETEAYEQRLVAFFSEYLGSE